MCGKERQYIADTPLEALNEAMTDLKNSGVISEDQLNSFHKWEMFCDQSYYDMWAVRKIGDRDFNSPALFHFNLRTEAERLLNYLNSQGV